MKKIGYFSEMQLNTDSGSAKEFIIKKINYDKDKVVKYLTSQKRIAGCPREAIDCITGETISPSFSIYTDGEYDWCDFLVYHIKKYSIKLPEEFISKIKADRKS